MKWIQALNPLIQNSTSSLRFPLTQAPTRSDFSIWWRLMRIHLKGLRHSSEQFKQPVYSWTIPSCYFPLLKQYSAEIQACFHTPSKKLSNIISRWNYKSDSFSCIWKFQKKDFKYEIIFCFPQFSNNTHFLITIEKVSVTFTVEMNYYEKYLK